MTSQTPRIASSEVLPTDNDLPSLDQLPKQSITSFLAGDSPLARSAEDASERFFPGKRPHLRPRIHRELFEHEISERELLLAEKFGRFPSRPSDLFLKLFHNVLATLKRDPLSGRVSPCLVGTSGVIPLTIISTIPDIMQHYYHCIVRAEKEVLLATNFWEKSASVKIIGKALRDLSRRAAEENRTIIVKIMIDHPTKENITRFHSILPVEKWSDYDIPLPEEMPNVSLEVNNYHRMIMGTFHAKFMIVDRRLALLNSNNIQDRPNLEMMSHFEGDIVHSFYDTYLISWWLPFQPAPVCLTESFLSSNRLQFGMNNSRIQSIRQPLKHAVAQARLRLQSHLTAEDSDVYLHAPLVVEETARDTASSEERFSTAALQALVQHRKAYSSAALVKATNDLASAVINYDLSPRAESPLTVHLNKSSKSAHLTKPDQNLSEEELDSLTNDFSPFVFHREHPPFPIALVNRLPRGTPGHIDIANPQDAAWLGAFRYAERSIFIQSPTLNASPAIEGILSACRRGVRVTLWLDLGFNDLTEGIGTFQGGTNEHVVKKLYKKLHEGRDGAEKYLEVFWYTGKDQTRPLNFSQKRRNCHIKFMSIDGQVAIMGNGNMDTQSWFHSQEINAMVDSPQIVQEWMDALYKNQSTGQYGKVGLEGVWRDDQGNLNPKNGR